MKVLVLGVTGMLGNAVFSVFSADAAHKTWGTLRSTSAFCHFPEGRHERLICGIDVLDQDALIAVMSRVKPDVVINCVGLIKPSHRAADQCHAAAPSIAALRAEWSATDPYQHRLRIRRT
jgi:dTDP-4-dehydrorhamnose reductase